MAGIGETLKNTRMEKGIALEQAEEETKIRSRYLEALEDEEYDIIPGKVYVKGFLKNYAEYLGLNGDELVLQYKSSTSTSSQDEQTPPKRKREKKKFDGTSKFVRKKSTNKHKKYAVTFFLAVAAVATLIIFNNYWGNNGVPANSDKITQENSNPDETSNGATGEGTPESPTPNNEQNPSQNQANNGNEATEQETVNDQKQFEGVNVVLKIKEQQCWVKVIIDGKTNYQGTMSPGDSKTFDGKENVKLILGNAGAADVVFNGEQQGQIGPYGKVETVEYPQN